MNAFCDPLKWLVLSTKHCKSHAFRSALFTTYTRNSAPGLFITKVITYTAYILTLRAHPPVVPPDHRVVIQSGCRPCAACDGEIPSWWVFYGILWLEIAIQSDKMASRLSSKDSIECFWEWAISLHQKNHETGTRNGKNSPASIPNVLNPHGAPLASGHLGSPTCRPGLSTLLKLSASSGNWWTGHGDFWVNWSWTPWTGPVKPWGEHLAVKPSSGVRRYTRKTSKNIWRIWWLSCDTLPNILLVDEWPPTLLN